MLTAGQSACALRKLSDNFGHYTRQGPPVPDLTPNEGRSDSLQQGTMQASDDEQLMLDVQQGSREAFETLFDRYRGPVWGFFRRRMDDADRAEELTQDTFLAILRGAARYEPRALFRTYLYGIALNILSAERRKTRKRRVETLENIDALPASSPGPDQAIWIREAIARLDPDEREILLLREYEQLTYLEIAASLRLPLNTVRSKLFRARLALKELLTLRVATSEDARS
jgi:RNA polymerase sigma-70 factor (ECF subfamily)